MIPEGWTELILSSISTKIGDGILSTPQYNESGRFYFINGNNISKGNLVFSDHTKKVDQSEFEKYKLPLSRRTIFISINGTIGNLARYRGEPVILGKSAAYININEDFCENFAFHVLSFERTQSAFLSQLTGSTINNLSLKAIRNTPLLAPKLPEQRRIAEILTTWDHAIDTVEALIANARAQKEALMQSLLTGKKRLTGFSGKARFASLSDVARIETGSSNREDSLDIGEFTFFDRSTDVRRSDRFLFDAEAIIIGGEGQEFVPKYFVGKFDLHQRAYALHSFDDAFGRYIFYAAHHSRHLLRRYAVGSTVASLRMPTFQKVKIWLPSVEEQVAIAEHLTLADNEIDGLSTQLVALRQEKSALMQQLLTGKRRVTLNMKEAA